MNTEQRNTILNAWKYYEEGSDMHDAFDFSPAAFNSLEEAFIALCKEHFGEAFIQHYEFSG